MAYYNVTYIYDSQGIPHMIKPSSHRSFATTAAVLCAVATFSMTGCSYGHNEHVSTTVNRANVTQTPAVQKVVGDYASEGYAKRTQGNDWVAVTVSPDGASAINIKVRARSDIKKPTCQYDGKATLMGQDDAHGIIFQSDINDSMAFFQFKGDTLTIDSQDKYALNYFCSGGGSIVGEYQKLAEKLKLH